MKAQNLGIAERELQDVVLPRYASVTTESIHPCDLVQFPECFVALPIHSLSQRLGIPYAERNLGVPSVC